MEDCRVVELRHRGELAEFSVELHEGEIPPAKGEDAGGELHRREGRWVALVWWIILSRFTRGSRNEETRIVTNEVFNEGQTEVTQEHGEEHPNSFDTWH